MISEISHDLISGISEYFFPPGDGVIGGAVVSILLLLLPGLYAWFKHLRPAMARGKENSRRTKEIHDHLNPDHPFTIGEKK